MSTGWVELNSTVRIGGKMVLGRVERHCRMLLDHEILKYIHIHRPFKTARVANIYTLDNPLFSYEHFISVTCNQMHKTQYFTLYS